MLFVKITGKCLGIHRGIPNQFKCRKDLILHETLSPILKSTDMLEDLVRSAPEHGALCTTERFSIRPCVSQWDALVKDDVDKRSLNRFTGRLDNNLEEKFTANYLRDITAFHGNCLKIVECWLRIMEDCSAHLPCSPGTCSQPWLEEGHRARGAIWPCTHPNMTKLLLCLY